MADSSRYLINIDLQVKNQQVMQRMVSELNKANKAAGTVSTTMKKASGSTRRFGNVAQNVGYQVQDMAVQIQGGTDVTRALSQQLPQMLVGFGAWGAAIGVVTALLPALISLVSETEEEAAKLSDTVINMGTVFKKVDLKAWTAQWESLDEAQKSASLSALEYTRIVRRLSLSTAAEQLTGGIGTEAPSGGIGRTARAAQLNYQKRLEETAKAAGLTTKQFKAFNAEIQKFEQSGFSDSSSIGAALEILYGAQGPDKANKALGETIKLTEELNSASREYQDTRGSNLLQPIDVTARRIEAASSGGGPLGTLEEITANGQTVDGLKYINIELARTEQLFKKLYPAASAFQATFQDLEEAKKRGIITQEEYNKRLSEAKKVFEASQEGWSLQTELIETFDQSFATMLDGVLQGTQSISEGFKSMAKVVIAEILKIAAYQAIIGAFGGAQGGGFGQTFAGAVGMNADGNVFSKGNVVPFARGGIVTRPTMFGMGSGGLGVMGEAGPEMIAPVKRMANGQMGVGASPVNVTVNNMASGVSVKTRETENGLTLDVVMEQVSAAIQKGGNSVANAIENTYSVGRGRAVY